jgi:GT2 family glycosyltransferase
MKERDTMLDIIIVNYKSTDYIKSCLQSIYDCIHDIPVRIFIQDNSSSDGLKCIKTLFPDSRITVSPYNLGFAKAINYTLKKCTAPYVMLLNPDTIVKEGFFEEILDYLQGHPNVGIVGPKILNGDGTVQGSARSFPTLLTGFFGRTSLLTKWFPNNWITRKSIISNESNGNNPIDVDWVSGACMVLKQSAIKKMGMMDERFFMYWEDVDWCRRMWIKGWKVIYYPKACVVHYVCGSSNKRPVKSIYEFHKSCYRYFVKYPAWPVKLLKPVVFFGLSIRFVVATVLQF